MTLKSLSLLAVLALTACASQAETSTPRLAAGGSALSLQDLGGSQVALPVGLFLTGLDVDRDLRVSRTEIRDGGAESFDASDKDDDGYLRPIEFEDWSRNYLGSASVMPSRLHFDRDQDTHISLSEFSATLDGIQERLDTDRDGSLARSELVFAIAGLGVNPDALRAEIEAEMRRNMPGKVREMCRGGR